MWHRKRKRWVTYFDSASPPYASVASAARVMWRYQRAGLLPYGDLVAACALPYLAARYPHRFD